MPRVSVIIPTFNCDRFLRAAIGSVLSQTYRDYELIVVDDGSTDNTQGVVASFGSKLHYLYQPNKGASSARNLALSKAGGDLIVYLDADDMWHPSKLEKQVVFLDAHREYGLVHCDATIVDENDGVRFHAYARETGRRAAQGNCTMDLLRRNSLITSAVVERRECIDRIATFDERLKVAEDYLHWIIMAMEGIAFGYIDEPLVTIRKRMSSLSASKWQTSDSLATMFQILLGEKSLRLRCGQKAADIVQARLHTLHRDLAYLDRQEGRTGQARRRAIRLIQESPLEIALYMELLKACVPFALAIKLRKARTWWRSQYRSRMRAAPR